MKLHLTLLDTVIFLSYILAVFFIGVAASRKGKKTKRDYFLAGDKLPWWLIGGSILAANISTHQIVGVMGVAYSRGFVAVVIEWGAILLGFNALLWIFLPFYLRNGFYTVPEFLQKRFGGGARTLYSLLVLLTYIFVEIGAVLFLGSLSLHELLGIPVMPCILIIAALTGVYTIVGGLKAVVWTEMLQICVLLAGMIILSVVTIRAAGGWPALMNTSKDWKIFLPANDQDFPWTQYLGGTVCISIFYFATNQFVVQRTLAAKSEWHARMGVIFAQYLKFLTPFLVIAPALVATKLFPNLEKPDLLFVNLVEHLLPSGLVGLVMAALMSAVMSHLSGAINSSTTIMTIDVYLPYIRKNATEAEAVRFGRIAGIVIILLGIISTVLLINYSNKPVFLYLANAYGLFTPGIAAMFLMGILWKRTTQAGALAAGILTIPMSMVLEFIYPKMPFLNRTGIVFWSCMALCVLVSLMTKATPAAALKGLVWTPQSLSLLPEERQQQHGLRNPFIWWVIITAAVLFFYIKYA